ncbi:MAG: ribosome silencing factor [Candidatus Goldiibacteriota bacterium]
MLKKIIDSLEEKKANHIKILDVSGISELWGYFVICSGTSDTHIRALRDNVEKNVEESGGRIYYKETGMESGWIIIDSGDILVHIFSEAMREYYSLERLWGGAEVADGDIIEEKAGGKDYEKKE